MATRYIGGSFAPPLTPEKLEDYKVLAEECQDRKVDGYMADLIKMVELFRETPESKNGGSAHPSGRGAIVPLEDSEIERIWDAVPWPEECDVMGKAFDVLPPGDLRNAAYHLLWYARELASDREPITTDKL